MAGQGLTPLRRGCFQQARSLSLNVCCLGVPLFSGGDSGRPGGVFFGLFWIVFSLYWGYFCIFKFNSIEENITSSKFLSWSLLSEVLRTLSMQFGTVFEILKIQKFIRRSSKTY